MVINRTIEKVKTFSRNLSLEYKLILFNIFVIVIPVTLIFAFTISSYINYLNDQLITSEFRSISQISSSLDNYLGELYNISLEYTLDKTLFNISKGPSDFDNKNYAVQNYTLARSNMQQIMITHQEILGIYLFCDNGNNYKIVRGNVLLPLNNYKEHLWYIAAKKRPNEGMLFAENVLEGYVDYDAQTLTYIKGINDYLSGEFLGVVMFSIEVDKFESLVELSSNNHNTTIITDNSGRVFYCSDRDKIGKVIINSFFANAVLARNEGYYINNSINGMPIAIFSTTSSYSGYKIVDLLHLNKLFAPINKAKRISTAILIFSVITLILVTVMYSEQLLYPIRKLTNAVEEFGRTSLSVIPVYDTNNEIGILTKSFSAMSQRINTLINREYAAQIKRKEAELSALQSKINPHFLYNTLEMIKSMSEEENFSGIYDATHYLSKILQYSLHFENELVTVREEIASVRYYVKIQQMRFNNRFKVIFDLPPKVLDCKILKFIIQPLVENSIYHGLETKLGSGVIIISGAIKPDGGLSITITDNGVGISEEDLKIIQNSLKSGINGFIEQQDDDPLLLKNTRVHSNRGFALMNIHTRLQLRYGTKSGLMINSSPNRGTTVTVNIDSINPNYSEEKEEGYHV